MGLLGRVGLKTLVKSMQIEDRDCMVCSLHYSGLNVLV